MAKDQSITLSIIIPFYNETAFLESAVASVCSQGLAFILFTTASESFYIVFARHQ